MVWVSPKMQIAEARGEDSKVQYLASSEARSRRPVVRSAKSAGHSLFGGGGIKEVRTIFFIGGAIDIWKTETKPEHDCPRNREKLIRKILMAQH